MNRDDSIDLLRGLAIIMMVAANAAPQLFLEPHPIAFRLYGSFAAPIFITLSGMVIGLFFHQRKNSLSFYLLRGFLLMGVGAFLDVVVWKMVPFITYDVLYLIGIATPLAWLSCHLKIAQRFMLVVLIFGLAPLLQKFVGYYPDYKVTLEFAQINTWPPIAEAVLGTINNLFISGDFPLFPWLGFSLLGTILGELRRPKALNSAKGPLKIHPFTGRNYIVSALLLLLAGGVLWYEYPGLMSIRSGWSELFYPATLGYTLFASGLVIALLALLDTIGKTPINPIITCFGSTSLVVYWAHEMIIGLGLNNLLPAQKWSHFFLLYIMLLIVLYLICRSVEYLRPSLKKLPMPIRFVFNS